MVTLYRKLPEGRRKLLRVDEGSSYGELTVFNCTILKRKKERQVGLIN